MPLPTIATPQYSCVLPSNNQTVRFRPFLVKEKKILMMAAEEATFDAMYTATKQIIENCILDKINIESLPLFDIQYLFLKIRCKSVGETSEFNVKCSSCEHENEISVNLEQVGVIKNPEHTDKIMLSSNVGIKMKYPDLTIEKTMSQGEKAQNDHELILKCIDYVFDGDSIYPAKDTAKEDLVQLLDSLSFENYSKIVKFFETIPKISHKINFSCSKCQTSNSYVINNLVDFFE